MAEPMNGMPASERAARLRVVQASAGRVGDDVASLGNSLRGWLEARTRDKPLQTAGIALAIGWLIGKRL